MAYVRGVRGFQTILFQVLLSRIRTLQHTQRTPPPCNSSSVPRVRDVRGVLRSADAPTTLKCDANLVGVIDHTPHHTIYHSLTSQVVFAVVPTLLELVMTATILAQKFGGKYTIATLCTFLGCV